MNKVMEALCKIEKETTPKICQFDDNGNAIYVPQENPLQSEIDLIRKALTLQTEEGCEMSKGKYKGKRVDNGQWAYGSFLSSVIALTGEGVINGQITIDNKTPFTAIVDEGGCVYQVVSETVGQLEV